MDSTFTKSLLPMESTIVVKVKYEETLRRFNARVVQGELDLNIDGLMGKVFELFNFAPNTDVTLTYIDEDGDVVTLSDDEDMRDVMRQYLNPLRITVKLNTEKIGSWHAKSTGNSIPMRTPRVQQPLNTTVHELLKSVPGPVYEEVSKLSTSLVSGPTPYSPVVAEVVDVLSRMGLTYLKQVLDTQGGTPVDACRDKEKVVPNEGQTSEILPSGESKVPNVDGNELDKGNNCAAISDKPLPASLNFIAGPSLDEMEELKKSIVDPCSNVGQDKKAKSILLEPRSCAPAANSSQTHILPNLNECPFSGTKLEHGKLVPPYPQEPPFPFERRHLPVEGGIVNVFHRGVRCDGCGVHPITGIRFKSKVKSDYDLCSICFEAMGNLADYIRIERPLRHRRTLNYKSLCNPHDRIRPDMPPKVLNGSVTKPCQPKLDSSFIQDVTILDGMVMAPSTPFTKIWRMKNNGTVKWPCGSRLLWIGGDRLNAIPMAKLEIPADGFPEDKELDAAVNFVAPEVPGQYISYWRMLSPEGQQFGQHVWVQIQVDASLSLCNTRTGINLNLPLVRNGIFRQPLNFNLNEPVVAGQTSFSVPQNSGIAGESVQAVAEMQLRDQDLDFPINDNLLVGEDCDAGANLEAYPAGASPLMDYSDLSRPVGEDRKMTDHEVSGNNNNVFEQNLLKELEEIMGFKQVDLNKEVLRMNEYKLERSVDDLCGVAEWNPILQELKEMGFCDDEINKRLLKKNNGSIKRVVMDLLAGERI